MHAVRETDFSARFDIVLPLAATGKNMLLQK